MNTLALVLLAQMTASPAPPTPVMGQRSLADVARERSQRTGGVKPTPIVLDLPTPAPVPTSAMRPARDLGPDYDAQGLPTTNGAAFRATAAARTPAYEPTPTTIAVERGAADAVADFGAKFSLFGLGFAGFGLLFGLLFIGIVWLLSPLLGLRIGRSKGYPDWAGALAGFLLGPFVLFMGLISKSSKKCPFCQSNIPIAAIVCPRCQRDQPKGNEADAKESPMRRPLAEATKVKRTDKKTPRG